MSSSSDISKSLSDQSSLQELESYKSNYKVILGVIIAIVVLILLIAVLAIMSRPSCRRVRKSSEEDGCYQRGYGEPDEPLTFKNFPTVFSSKIQSMFSTKKQ